MQSPVEAGAFEAAPAPSPSSVADWADCAPVRGSAAAATSTASIAEAGRRRLPAIEDHPPPDRGAGGDVAIPPPTSMARSRCPMLATTAVPSLPAGQLRRYCLSIPPGGRRAAAALASDKPAVAVADHGEQVGCSQLQGNCTASAAQVQVLFWSGYNLQVLRPCRSRPQLVINYSSSARTCNWQVEDDIDHDARGGRQQWDQAAMTHGMQPHMQRIVRPA